MLRLLLNWVFSALALLIASRLISGFDVSGFGAALLAAVVVGLVNATFGLVLHVLTFPLAVLTLGIFWFIVNALMLKLASAFVPGFTIVGFLPAFWGAIVLSLTNMIFRWLTRRSADREFRY
jgi:putative membrane protein